MKKEKKLTMSKAILCPHNGAIGFHIRASDLYDNHEQLCHYYRYEFFHIANYSLGYH